MKKYLFGFAMMFCFSLVAVAETSFEEPPTVPHMKHSVSNDLTMVGIEDFTSIKLSEMKNDKGSRIVVGSNFRSVPISYFDELDRVRPDSDENVGPITCIVNESGNSVGIISCRLPPYQK